MKSFLNYSKNRILYNLLRILIIFLIVFLISKIKVNAAEFTTIPEYYISGFQSGSMSSFNDGVSQVYIAYYQNINSTNQIYFKNLNVSQTLNASNTYRLKFSFFYGHNDESKYCNSTTYSDPNLRLYYSGGNYLANLTNTNYKTNRNASLNGDQVVKCEASWDFTVSSNQNITSMLVSIAGTSMPFYTPNYLALWSTYSITQVSTGVDSDAIIGEQEKTNEKLDYIQEQNKEAEETRKGIWETIKNLPNMFLDMLKSLFIPSNDFFEGFINDFFGTLQEKLGFLLYPFEVFIDIINRFLEIPEGNGIIHIPQINDPFYDHELIPEQDFNIGEIFKTGKIGELHNIYLIFIDFYIIIKLVNLALKKFNTTIGGGVTE